VSFGACEHAATTEINATTIEINPMFAIRLFITKLLATDIANTLILAIGY
jgi:hypothetical protein